MKISTLVMLVLVAGGVYYGLAFGGVYWRRYRLVDKVEGQLTYAGQLADETIREQLVTEIKKMNLPPAASRVRMVRTAARTIQVSIAYTETVNLLYTTKQIPVSVTERRTY
ncbi:MAG: hypothetical protein OEY20_09330 [Gemmatimonadota bacterium]|nr:hypothetical protein [Gemmatimonadota bacterium]